MKIGFKTGVGILCASAFLATLTAPARAQDTGLGRQLEEGVDLLKRGQTEQANAKFRAILASDPSSEEAYNLVRSTSARQFLEMLKARGDAAQVAERILSLAQKAEVEHSKDPAAIQSLASAAVTSRDLIASTRAAEQLAAKHGEFAVPALVAYLGSNDIDTRTNAILALAKIGPDAVMPLAASLGSGTDVQQRNTAQVLGLIGDQRAIPALLRAAKGNGPAAAEAARSAAKLGSKGGDPTEGYLHLGAQYLMGDSAVVLDYDRSSTVWSMKDGQLTGTQVPRFLYTYELAEQAAYDALTTSPGNPHALAMIALVQFAEQAAYDNLPETVKATDAAKEGQKNIQAASALGAAAGADNLNLAFAMASKLRMADAASRIADALVAGWYGKPVDGSSALVQGLSNENRSIRYASAIALLEICPAGNFPGAEKVASLAGEAAKERATKSVLVVDSDSKNAMTVQRALNDAGFHAVAYTNGVDALMAAKQTAGGYDAIVIRSRLQGISPFQVLDEIGRDFRTSGMKKIVMAEGADLSSAAGEFEKRSISGVAPTASDAAGVVGAVRKAVESPEGDAGRITANALSIKASNAIASCKGCAAVNMKDAIPGLADAASEGADENVRLAALRALANVASPETQGALRGILTKKENSVAVRTAAAHALGRALRGAAPAPETFSALLDAMGEDDPGLRGAAAGALGSAKLSAAQSSEIMTKRRM